VSAISRAFVYEQKDSWLYRLNPYTKIAAGLILIVASLAFFSFEKALSLFVLMLTLSASAKKLRSNAGSLVPSAPFAIIIFIAEFLLGRSVLTGFAYALRFVDLVFSSSIMFTSVSPDEIDYMARKVLRWRDFSFLISTTYKFIPVLASDISQIIEVQKARGVDFDTKNIFKLLKNYYTILVPLFVVSIVRSQQLAEALELRGYGASEKPTFIYEYPLRTSDLIFMILILSLIVCIGMFA
jgi:energy-coupling factor transport system permease protein